MVCTTTLARSRSPITEKSALCDDYVGGFAPLAINLCRYYIHCLALVNYNQFLHFSLAMAEKSTGFSYHNIELYKSESLGSGSYGGVCKAKCDGLLCAAKIMHPTLFDLRDPGTVSYLRKFQEECHLLSLARHPNVVQYLGTYTDPDTRLPVLLMELCDESLTSFLERSPQPLSYHIQVNICHDIALALVYLHSNGLIHRDLTGNNILMIAGPRAKITDFGMSKLANVNPRMTALTLCPGNVLYMSPEALDEAKAYTSKLDMFSFGVIVIQILTRQFPSPSERFRNIHVVGVDKNVRELIPETERRASHLNLITDTHSLKPLALQCLQKERERPSALWISGRLSELKQASQYTESMRCCGDIQQLKQQLQDQISLSEVMQEQITELETLLCEKERQIQENEQAAHATNTTLRELQSQIIEMTNNADMHFLQQLQKDKELQAMDRQLQEKHHSIAVKEKKIGRVVKELQQTKRQLHASDQLLSECQQILEQRDVIVADLQQSLQQNITSLQCIVSAYEGNVPLQDTEQSQPSETAVTAAQKDVIRWKEQRNAPERMSRGAAVVHGNTAYFRPAGLHSVYSYCSEEQWYRLPDNPNGNCGLAIIDGFLTSVGGYNNGCCTNTLLSLTGEGERRQWSEIIPSHAHTASQCCVCYNRGISNCHRWTWKTLRF